MQYAEGIRGVRLGAIARKVPVRYKHREGRALDGARHAISNLAHLCSSMSNIPTVCQLPMAPCNPRYNVACERRMLTSPDGI